MVPLSLIGIGPETFFAYTLSTATYNGGGHKFRNAYANQRVKATMRERIKSYTLPGRPFGSANSYGGDLSTTTYSVTTVFLPMRITGNLAAAADSTWSIGTYAETYEGIGAGLTGQTLDEDFSEVLFDYPLSDSRFFVPLHLTSAGGRFISLTPPTHPGWSVYPYVRQSLIGPTPWGPVGNRACFLGTLLYGPPNIAYYIDNIGSFGVSLGNLAIPVTSGPTSSVVNFDSGWFPSAWGVPPVRVRGYSSVNDNGTYPATTQRYTALSFITLEAVRIDGTVYTVATYGPTNWTQSSRTYNSTIQRTSYTFDQTYTGIAPIDAMFLRWTASCTPTGASGGGSSFCFYDMPAVPTVPNTATSDYVSGVRSPGAFIFRAP